MKIAALILGLLGSLAAIGLGVKLNADYDKYADTIGQLSQLTAQLGQNPNVNDSLKELREIHIVSYALMGLGLLSLIASTIVFKTPKASGAIMLATAIILATAIMFAIFNPKTLIFSFLLVIAGLLALLSKKKISSTA